MLGEVVACDRCTADLSRPETLRQTISEIRPDVIVNAAAYTAVDQAEAEERLAHTVNADAVEVLAREAKARGALLVHCSTDYVFDGTKEGAYLETDAPNPRNAYGRSKLAGEEAVASAGADSLVLRMSWVYGARGKNFLRTILRLAMERETLRVVADQVGAPTPARMIADVTAHIVRATQAERQSDRFESGLFHLSAKGATTWHGFAAAIVDRARASLPAGTIVVRTLAPIPTSEYPTPAMRPSNSQLDNTKLESRFDLTCAPWERLLQYVLDDLLEQSMTSADCG